MNKLLKKNNFLILSSLISIILLTLVLSKVFFTPMGYDSIGRMFHFYINYEDFGFMKRALWGTFLHYIGLNNILENKYIEYLIIYLLMSIAFVIIFWYFFYKKTPSQLSKQDIYLALIAVFSPSIFLHLGYSPGNFDVILMFIYILNIIILEKNKLVLASLISSGAILLHEIYIFTSLPLLLWLLLEKFGKKSILKFSILPIITSLILLVWGKLSMSKEAYLLQLDKISPLFTKIDSRNGYIELTSSIQDNISMSFRYLSDIHNFTFFPIVVIYIVLMFIFLLYYSDQRKNKYFFLGILACFTPLTLSIVAYDVYRWVSFVVFNMVLFMLISRKEEFCYSTKPTIVLVIAIVLFVFLGPMGDLFNNRPFPIIQTILQIN